MHIVNEQVVIFDASCMLYIHGANPNYARSLKDHILGVLAHLKTSYYIGIIDGKGNYRYDIAVTAPYKGNRNKANILELFPYFYEVKQELIETYGFHLVNGIEADDMVGILNKRLNPYQFVYIEDPDTIECEQVELTTYKSFIASIDKDLHQLDGCHYNLKSHKYLFSNTTTSDLNLAVKRDKINGTGYKFLYAQCLTGDLTDNIPGLYKCGPVSAYEILKNCKDVATCEQAVISAFIEKETSLNKLNGSTEEELQEAAMKKYNEMKSLVFILRQNSTVPALSVNKYRHKNQ